MSSTDAPHQTVWGLLVVPRRGGCLFHANGGHKKPPGPKSGGFFSMPKHLDSLLWFLH